MMKFALIFLLFGSSCLASAQEIDSMLVSDSLEAHYIHQLFTLDNYCIYHKIEDDTTSPFIRYDDGRFQFYLYNSTDTVVIFDGELCGGHEKGVVNVYRFIDGKPKSILSRPGKVAHIEKDEIWIYDYPCCAQVLNLITPFSSFTGEQLSETHVFYDRNDFAAIFPIREKASQQYILVRDSEIRSSPSRIDQFHVPVCGNRENIIGNFPKGQSMTLLKVTSNDWALVRFDYMKTVEAFCVKEYYANLIGKEEYHLYGWVALENIQRE